MALSAAAEEVFPRYWAMSAPSPHPLPISDGSGTLFLPNAASASWLRSFACVISVQHHATLAEHFSNPGVFRSHSASSGFQTCCT
ncbi:hypothetical protein BAUCODRAFT_228683 [Baudoinia panamericana UAMH 10762]|uniref:Uncharacterized protein n=1 Tax=Baudoinia panamericana (strain UAMH 10762) TaxID=717646 RepID=M2N688_BAUPA|nr:uncharacterized protein BAUCODRAFT_228683 [Baudoinia panamericana UAMH 10762]EMC94300.1 hypothetical protein BAUCODRAFT_228683 [Baudoinia panamericana UAMH 10762]